MSEETDDPGECGADWPVLQPDDIDPTTDTSETNEGASTDDETQE